MKVGALEILSGEKNHLQDEKILSKNIRRYFRWMKTSGPGVDVMITIFGDFRQFLAKKLAFFSKTNVMIKIFHNLALFWVKNANFFAEFFGENI
jgi:hypothetical protein